MSIPSAAMVSGAAGLGGRSISPVQDLTDHDRVRARPDRLLTHLEPYTFQDGFARPSLDAVCGLKGPLHQNPGEELETYDFSALYHYSPRVQGLLELNGEVGLSSDEAGEGIVAFSPGVKVAPFARHPLFVGLGGSFPLGEEELNARLKLAFFYPF